MKKPKLKFCGLKSVADAALVNQFLPDYAGFVFAGAKRRVDSATALAMRERLSPAIQTVGVFVNEAIAVIADLCERRVIDLVQLHGDEDADYIAALRRAVSNPLIKAVRVRGADDIAAARAFDCDYLLFDAYSPAARGGTGHRFDWAALRPARVKKPFFLAGGINADNIEAAAQTAPYCLDISSGIERNGVKDKEAIETLIRRFADLRETP